MRFWNKIRAFCQRRRNEANLAEEIRIHRQMAADAGLDPAAFGSEAYFLEESRAVWQFAWLESLGQDVRYAVRGLRRAPLFALTVVGTVGVALGLNTTLFTVFDAYVLRTIAVRDPYSLYSISWTSRKWHYRVDWQNYRQLRRPNSAFSDVAASEFLYGPMDGRFGVGQMVSGNYFPMLQPGGFAGRLIGSEDATSPGAGAVMVLSFHAWQNWYGGSPDALGRKVLLRGQPFEIVGIAGPAFSGNGSILVDYWIPLTMDPLVFEGADLFGPAQPERLELLARLKPGVSQAAARAELWAWASAATEGLPPDQRANGVRMESNATAIHLTPEVIAVFSPIWLAFGLVLAAACANVSNMMLARALARQREIDIRVSLGAGRARLVRQLLTESLLLAAPAALAGFAISQAAIRFAQWLMFATLPAAFAKIVRLPALDPDARVFGFILAASFAATLIFGLVPALQTTRSSLGRGGFANDYRPTRLRNLLVAAQAMVCCLLLIYSFVMLRSERLVAGLDIGMRTRGVFDVLTPAKHKAAAAERLAAQPGIEAVAGAWRAPLCGPLHHIAVIPAGRRNEVLAGYDFVSPQYFTVLRIPIVEGRAFSEEEARANAAVVVISQATAGRFWPGGTALGQTLSIPPIPPEDAGSTRVPQFRAARVIGIARDAASGFVGDGLDRTCLYFPTTRSAANNESLLVAVRGDKDAGRRLVDATVNLIAPDAAEQVNPLDEVLATMIYPFRVIIWIGGFLAGLALLLTVSGVYGVMSFAVSQRSREIGIRMALGANGPAVVRMVVAQAMRMAGIGALVGGGLALAVAPVFAHQIEVVRPYDVLAYLAGVGTVCAASLGAAAVPSRRAVRIDPVAALRCD
jgi:predicted permease